MTFQTNPSVVPVSDNAIHDISAVDKDFAIAIRYVGGTTITATVETNGSGDFTFKVGGAADATLGIPSADGIIDISNAAANTWGEVVDEINSSANWEAVLIGRLRADQTDPELSLSAVDAVLPVDKSTAINYWGGHALYGDTSIANRLGFLFSNRNLQGARNRGRRWQLSLLDVEITSIGDTTLKFYAVPDDDSAEVQLGHSITISSASQTIIDDNDLGNLLLMTEPGQGLLVHFTGAAAISSPTVKCIGGYAEGVSAAAQKFTMADL